MQNMEKVLSIHSIYITALQMPKVYYTIALTLFSPLHERLSSVFQAKRQLTPAAVRESLTNHKQVVAWWLLDAVGPVLLMRSGILQKGLPAQWQSNIESEQYAELTAFDYYSIDS